MGKITKSIMAGKGRPIEYCRNDTVFPKRVQTLDVEIVDIL